MIARPQIEGLDRVLARLAKIKLGVSKLPTAVVHVKGKYPSGPTVAEVAAIHAQGSGHLPARNPFFLSRVQRGRALRRIRQGVLEIHKGLSSGMRQTMSDVGKQAAKDIGQNLDRSQHAPLGASDPAPTRMAPLSPAYAAWKKQMGYPRKPLIRTGRYRKGITHTLED